MLLTMKDQQRVEVIQALMDGRLSAAQAAQVLGRSERQVWRLLGCAREDGLSGLLHGNRGREPVNKSDDRLWQRVLKLAAEKYRGVNDRHLQELLAREHGLTVCRESLRKRLRAAGLEPKRSRRQRKYRARRERRAAAGMLLQIDASPHDWLEGRGSRLTLVGAIDDATNQAWVRFAQAETTASPVNADNNRFMYFVIWIFYEQTLTKGDKLEHDSSRFCSPNPLREALPLVQ